MIIDVALVPAEIPESHQLGGLAVVVIDVLRATSTIVTALAAGANSVVPVAEPGEARNLAAALGNGAVLAGEREGLPLPGFHLGNSPIEFTADQVAGRTVVLTTTNGTYTLRRVQSAGAVAVAAFLNADAAAAWAAGQLQSGRQLMIACSGTVRRFTWEDACLAGLLTDLVRTHVAGVQLTDGAQAATQVWAGAGSPQVAVTMSRHGKHLAELGFGNDLEYCAKLSIINAVPELRDARLVLPQA